MKAYIFRAALYCEQCAASLEFEHRDALPPGASLDDESSYDSDQFPKGPYPDGGGEADAPQHCDACGTFLQNPLTEDGSTYVKAAWRAFIEGERGRLDVLQQWREGYPCEWTEFCQEIEAGYWPPLSAESPRFLKLAERERAA